MKKILALVVAAAVLATVGIVFALDYAVPPEASTLTARFFVIEDWEQDGIEFSMLSECEELIIHISDFVDLIYFEDDFTFVRDALEYMSFNWTLAEFLDGRRMTITYAFTTMSIPAQTTPISVRVLFEDIMPLPAEIDDIAVPIDDEFDFFNLNGEIVVNGEIIDAPAPLVMTALGTADDPWGGVSVNLPLRAIAEALGYDVSWSEETQSIMLGVGVHVFVGRDAAYIGRGAPVPLSAAPFILENLTFIPLDFFRSVLGQTVYVFEGQVVIETDTDMF